MFCPGCRLEQPTSHSFCVRCGGDLPSDLLAEQPFKRARFFAGVKVADEDPEGGYLRVSCYRREHRIDRPEGSVVLPGHHVRFSVWVDSEVKCVLSIPESEARELAAFLRAELSEASATSPV